MRIKASDPRYPAYNLLQTLLLAAVNRAPFSEFEHMPEPERQVAIFDIKRQMAAFLEPSLHNAALNAHTPLAFSN